MVSDSDELRKRQILADIFLTKNINLSKTARASKRSRGLGDTCRHCDSYLEEVERGGSGNWIGKSEIGKKNSNEDLSDELAVGIPSGDTGSYVFISRAGGPEDLEMLEATNSEQAPAIRLVAHNEARLISTYIDTLQQ